MPFVVWYASEAYNMNLSNETIWYEINYDPCMNAHWTADETKLYVLLEHFAVYTESSALKSLDVASGI